MPPTSPPSLSIDGLSATFNVSGTIDDFNASQFHAALAAGLNLSAADVALTNVTGGSVLIAAKITLFLDSELLDSVLLRISGLVSRVEPQPHTSRLVGPSQDWAQS